MSAEGPERIAVPVKMHRHQDGNRCFLTDEGRWMRESDSIFGWAQCQSSVDDAVAVQVNATPVPLPILARRLRSEGAVSVRHGHRDQGERLEEIAIEVEKEMARMHAIAESQRHAAQHYRDRRDAALSRAEKLQASLDEAQTQRDIARRSRDAMRAVVVRQIRLRQAREALFKTVRSLYGDVPDDEAEPRVRDNCADADPSPVCAAGEGGQG